jgi:hypothetical protein
LNNFESRFSQTMNLTSLPLGSNKLSLQDEHGYPRVSTGDSPRQKMAPISGKFQPSNPNKQPCMYSTLPPLSQMQCFKSNSVCLRYHCRFYSNIVLFCSHPLCSHRLRPSIPPPLFTVPSYPSSLSQSRPLSWSSWNVTRTISVKAAAGF